MNKFEFKAINQYSISKFDLWKQYLTDSEIAVFELYYFRGFSLVKISMLEHYSERQVSRLLKSARKKIYKLLP